ncbi:hypothetical protein D5S18_26955 [Nocardia panacis]|uniref:Guanylate cyclase domain-containing protein n=1 Tax=Nocardia panacis TaxID=2340916 RepID=A0A3A4KB59_9NOCA|nr:hypothetical protein [Nocardia panacis]RJO70831.1 hypothetical protein D5S18_26955 [Nocardia panacis]
MNAGMEYRALLATDIVRSSGRGTVPLLRMRAALAEAVRESVRYSGIEWSECHRADLGDGIRVIAPPGVAKFALIHPLLADLARRLREHNRAADPVTRIRLRVAVHAGDIHLAGAPAGAPLEVLARLLDAEPMRRALASAPERVCLAALVSEHFYEETVPQGYPGIDPQAFRRVAFTEKNYTAHAWLHLPQSPIVPAVDDPAADPQPAADRPTQINTAHDRGTVQAVQNGNLTIHTDR